MVLGQDTSMLYPTFDKNFFSPELLMNLPGTHAPEISAIFEEKHFLLCFSGRIFTFFAHELLTLSQHGAMSYSGVRTLLESHKMHFDHLRMT